MTFAFVLSDYTKKNGKKAIQLRITENRKVVPIKTGFEIEEKYWDSKKERVKSSYPNSQVINDALRVKLEETEATYAELSRLAPSARQVADLSAGGDFYAFTEKQIAKLKPGPRKERYEGVIATLKMYAPELNTRQLTPEFVQEWKEHLKASGGKQGRPLKHNSVVVYLSTLKTLISAHPRLKKNNPFDEVKIGTGRKGKKDWLTVEEIEALYHYIPSGKWDRIARDMFLFSYYTAGLRLKDVILIRWTDIRNGRVEVTPQKTGESSGISISVPLHPRAEGILKNYDRSTPTIFNLINQTDEEAIHKLLKVVRGFINAPFKTILSRLQIDKHITMHCARHSFSNNARALTGDIYWLKDAMGHTNLSTTEIYVAANQKIVDERLKKVYG